MVSYQIVGRVSDPERRGSLIDDQKTPGLSGVHDKIVLDRVVGFSSIFNKYCVPHGFVDHIVLEFQVVDAVDGDASIEGLVNSVLSDVGTIHITGHVEMNRVPTQLESLSNIRELDILDPTRNAFAC